MDEVLRPDICVIGAGSAGLSVAAAAAAFGVSVVLVERGKMGGECLNVGCVPSKALIAAARHAHQAREASAFGVQTGEVQANFGKVRAHIAQVIAEIAPTDSEARFTALGVRVIRDRARFTDRRTVVAGGAIIRARRFVVATGSRPLVPPVEGLDQVAYFTNETIFDNGRKPQHLIVLGGGPVGLELAQAYRRLGAEVSVIEADRPMSKDDPELSRIVLDGLAREGVAMIAPARLVRVAPRGGGLLATIEENGTTREIEGSHLLVAAGRVPNADDLGLDAAGIAFDAKTGIAVNAGLRTSNRRVYAIGDVTGGLQFTHAANYQAGLVVRAILFRLPSRMRREMVPWVTFTDPELAQVGLSEHEARARHGTIRVLRWPYAENDRARAERETAGLIKVVTSGRGRVLGATIVGAQAGEIANMWSLIVARGMNIRAVTGFVSPYPTFGEIGKRAAIAYYADRLQTPVVQRIIRFLRILG